MTTKASFNKITYLTERVTGERRNASVFVANLALTLLQIFDIDNLLTPEAAKNRVSRESPAH